MNFSILNPREVVPTPVYTYAQLGLLNYRIPIPNPLPLLMDFYDEPHKDIEGLRKDAQAVLRNIREFNK